MKPCDGTLCAHRAPEEARALADSGHLNDFFDLAEGYFARGIEQRLTESGRRLNLGLSKLPQRELGARASAFAGSLLSLLRWWLDRGAKESPHDGRAVPPDGVERAAIVAILRPALQQTPSLPKG